MLLLIESNITGGISVVMGKKYAKTDEKKKILYYGAKNFNGYSMIENLPHGDFKFDKGFKLDSLLNKPQKSEF